MSACKKESDNDSSPAVKETYASIDDFIKRNMSPLQTYLINEDLGGSFITPQGTAVTIPPNAFTKSSGAAVSGEVTIQFKDILKKSDMVLNNKPTIMTNGQLLVSGGEFYIRAIQEGNTLIIAPGSNVDVALPIPASATPDTSMFPLAVIDTTSAGNTGNTTQSLYWQYYNANASLYTMANTYVYSIFQFTPPATSGSWHNCDHPLPGSTNTTTITMHNDQAQTYFMGQISAYLIFKDLNSGIQLFRSGENFNYIYAPCGEQCTVVSYAIKDGELYASFTPLTIPASAQTFDFLLSKTTTDEFKLQLEALN